MTPKKDEVSTEQEIKDRAIAYATGMMGLGEYSENWNLPDKQLWHNLERGYRQGATWAASQFKRIVSVYEPASPLKKLRLEDFPHLVEMKRNIGYITFGGSEYWRKRCQMLEKSLDPTYTDFERSNCSTFYWILVKKEI